MVLALALLATIAVIALAERSTENLLFAIAALFLNVTLLLFFVADIQRAVLIACLLTAVIAGASVVKYNHSALKLVVTDLPLVFAGTAPFFVVQYPRAVFAVVAGAVLFVFASVGAVIYAAGSPISLPFQVLLFGLALAALAIAARIEGGFASLQRAIAQPRNFYSTFMASLLDPFVWRQSRGFAFSDIADQPLPLLPAVPARVSHYPDIIVIQHESVFDPRIYGLPVEPVVEAFLSPPHGRHGGLHVDIFGGGSWQSEFSLLTGLSSASFGASAYHLFKKGAGRFHSSLPRSLAGLGYRTTLASSCRRSFLDYDRFYRSIGIEERIFTDDLPPPFDLGRFEATQSDRSFLQAVIDAHARKIAADATPRFLYVLTNFNHGPHDRRSVAPGRFERERSFAAASLPDPRYGEYYARLAETASTWQSLRNELAEKFPQRPMLVVHYGDHQPVLAKQLDRQLKLPADARRSFRTFYAIEALNVPPDRFVPGRGADLDIAFLGTLALQQAGLPLDPVFATRASLADDCRDGYFASPSERKRRFHRTLVEQGMVDVVPGVAKRSSLR